VIAHGQVSGAVLAGGRARRMGGANKALLPLGAGRADTPLSRMLAVFAGRFAETILVADDPSPYEGWPVRVVPDIVAGCGPLGGVHAAVSAARTPFVFVFGCDMPSLSGPLIDMMARRVLPGRLLVPVYHGRPEPLHAIYPVSCRDEARRALDEGVRMMREFFDRVPVDYLPEEEIRALDGAVSSFENINTPDDLRRSSR